MASGYIGERCPRCGYPLVSTNYPSYAYCETCRQYVPSRYERCMYCGQALIGTQDLRMNYCPSCGRYQWSRVARKAGGIVGPSSILTLAVPVVALVVALLIGSRLLLNYVHVITGGTWTGIDLFMGLVMSRVMRGLSPQGRSEIIKKLVPIMLFFMPSLASVTITAGIYLALSMGISLFSTPIIIAGIIVLILSIQGFGLLLPNEVRILLELRKPSPNIEKVSKLGMRNIYIAGSQSIFQIAIIFVMAYIATIY